MIGLELLVRDYPADKHHVCPAVIEIACQQAARRPGQVAEIRYDWQHRRARESQRLEFGAVVLRVAEREIAAFDVRRELAAPSEALLDEVAVHADKVQRRRNVVVHERHAPRQRVGSSRGPGSDREMMDEDVFGCDCADHLTVVDRAIFETAIGCLDEDLRLVSGAAGVRAESREPRGRWHRRSRVLPAPDAREDAWSCRPIPARIAARSDGARRQTRQHLRGGR